jgi:hypothetical protein
MDLLILGWASFIKFICHSSWVTESHPPAKALGVPTVVFWYLMPVLQSPETFSFYTPVPIFQSLLPSYLVTVCEELKLISFASPGETTVPSTHLWLIPLRRSGAE